MFTEPLPPLCEIADECGLAHRDDRLAPHGFDFDRWHLERKCAVLAERYDLDSDDAFVLHMLVRLYGQIALICAVGGEERVEEVLAAAEEDTTGALGMFADVLEPKVPRAARVAFRWLRAVALERIGDIDAAERELLTAESMDRDWPLPLLDLARIASDRDPLVKLLERYRAEPRRDLGRNQPCWCGSGRKYKKYHLGQEQLPLCRGPRSADRGTGRPTGVGRGAVRDRAGATRRGHQIGVLVPGFACACIEQPYHRHGDARRAKSDRGS